MLDFDIVASGSTEQEALERVPGLIATFLEAARRYGSGGEILRPAPPEDWNRYLRAAPGSGTWPLPESIRLPGVAWEFRECEVARYAKAA